MLGNIEEMKLNWIIGLREGTDVYFLNAMYSSNVTVKIKQLFIYKMNEPMSRKLFNCHVTFSQS